MSSAPLFSIIMPTHNRASLIPLGINSIINQVYKNWELLIIDDGSIDETKAVVDDYQDSRIKYHFQHHKERSTARNKGIKLARGQYICFIDDDDYLIPNHLEVFANAVKENPSNSPILRVGYFREAKGSKTSTHLYDPQKGMHPAHYAALHFCGVWSLAIPKEYLQEHQFPPQFRHWQDTHLIIRLLALYPFRQLPEFTYVYRIHDVMGSLRVYQEADVAARIESNVAAMHHLFENYAPLVHPVLPANLHHFLVCEKYVDHAHGAMITGNLNLAWSLFRKSWKYNTGHWFYWRYVKFLIRMPLKYLTGYPKRN